MATNWVTPTVAGAQSVIATASLRVPTEQNEDADTQTASAIARVVARVRGAIRAAGRFPLSCTSGTVPPEAESHVYALAIRERAQTTRALSDYILSESFRDMAREARDWLDAVAKGGPVTMPDDPTGADYATAVSDHNAPLESVSWGDQYGSDADYEAGSVTDPNTGATLTLPVDMTTS